MMIALFVLVWFLLGLAGACGRAYGQGYLYQSNTKIGTDVLFLIMGPVGALLGLCNAFACMGSFRHSQILLKKDK